jgi:hypothetical protein
MDGGQHQGEWSRRTNRLMGRVAIGLAAALGVLLAVAPSQARSASLPMASAATGGTGAVSLSATAPVVTEVAPVVGPIAGGSSVTITGTDLSGATRVVFGTTAATSFTVDSGSQITAIAPAHPTGLINIRVATPGGTSAIASRDQFTFKPPVPAVTGATPVVGPTAGGTPVTITGTNLSGATRVVFGTTQAISFTVDSSSQITAVAPAHPTGLANIRVSTPGGTSPIVFADRFTFRPPVPALTGVTAATGPMAGGTSVTITGTNLSGAIKVVFGTTEAAGFTVDSGSQITAISPAEPVGRTNIRVTTPGGTSPVTTSDSFTAEPVGYPFCGTLSGTPTTSKLMVIYEENQNASAIYNAAAAPYLNAFAADCGHATDFRSLTHPSLPNYMASTSGVSYAFAPWNGDCLPQIAGCFSSNDNIFNQVGASGWRAYAESMPKNCASTGVDYVARHNPAEYYSDVAAQCPFDDLPMGTPTSGALAIDVADATLPTFSTVTPNLNDDMHSGSVAQGDAWLGTWLPTITSGPDYQSGDLTIAIVWDEGTGTGDVPSTVPMIVLSPYIVPGTTSSAFFTHYSLLKAAEDVAGVPELAEAATAGDLRSAFGF